MMRKLTSWPVRWIILSGLFAAYLLPRLDRERAILWSVVLGCALTMSIGWMRVAATARRDRRLIERAESAQAPRDGEVIAVAGQIETAGEPLRSPVRAEPSIIYEFSAFHRAKRKHHKEQSDIADYAGYGIAAPVVRGAVFSAPLRSFPYLHGFERAEIDTPETLVNVKEHIRFGQPQPPPAGEMLEHTKAWDGKWNGEPSRLVRNFRADGAQDLAKCRFREEIVSPGTTVCALGVWSSARQGLIAAPGQELWLYRGSPEQVKEELSVSNGCGLFLAVLFAAGSVATAAYLVS
ncbi:MAG TPA: hypothetical protein VM166_11925 [Gemmatimonadaceae bacterium]|nr:hypothetical protein [Gemmatimonadaceae bacterium]